MSDVVVLMDLLRAARPVLELRLDLPVEPNGAAWLDVEWQGRVVSVEWRPRRGFGVSLLETSAPPEEGLFEGPDEILTTPAATRDRILCLLFAKAGEDRPLQAARFR